jgi:membrane-bound metal-dependent hydrolase YbcI (DUF457 family)
MSIAADLDVIPGLLVGSPARYHSGVTHSLAAGLLASVIVAGILTRRGAAFGMAFTLGFSAYATHLGLDFVGVDSRYPFGIPLLWPFGQEYYLSPVPLLIGVRHAATTDASTAEFVRGLLSLHNVAAIGLELLWVVPVLALQSIFRQQKRQAPAAEVAPDN